jgi:hypothetical protein
VEKGHSWYFFSLTFPLRGGGGRIIENDPFFNIVFKTKKLFDNFSKAKHTGFETKKKAIFFLNKSKHIFQIYFFT